MDRLIDLTNAAQRQYKADMLAIRGNSSLAADAKMSDIQDQLRERLQPAYRLLEEYDARDAGYRKELAALGIVREVNGRIRTRIVEMTRGEVSGIELSFIVTDPKHSRSNFAVIEELTCLTSRMRDIAEVRELVSELTSRYVASLEMPPVTVEFFRTHGDLKFTFEFPY